MPTNSPRLVRKGLGPSSSVTSNSSPASNSRCHSSNSAAYRSASSRSVMLCLSFATEPLSPSVDGHVIGSLAEHDLGIEFGRLFALQGDLVGIAERAGFGLVLVNDVLDFAAAASLAHFLLLLCAVTMRRFLLICASLIFGCPFLTTHSLRTPTSLQRERRDSLQRERRGMKVASGFSFARKNVVRSSSS